MSKIEDLREKRRARRKGWQLDIVSEYTPGTPMEKWKKAALVVAAALVLIGFSALLGWAILETVTAISEAWHEGAK